MIKVTEIAFVGYPVTDATRAKAFYEGLLGLKSSMDETFPGDQFWIEYEIGANTLALSNSWPPSGKEGPTVGLEVDDFEHAIAELRAANVTFTFGPFETPVCFMANVLDPDGNSLIIHKRKPGHS